MINRFKTFIKENKLFTFDDNILLAVSGGIDSVAMVDLFSKLGIKCGVAHCNFHLRGKESNEDELFVRQLALNYDFQVYVEHFDTIQYAEKQQLSTQMAARQLRYNWFEKIRNSYNYRYIAIGHQLDDVVETFLINICRGTGIIGLTGIKAKKGKIVRPLLFARRDEIEVYAKKHQLAYREDSSNQSIKYIRNKIRHQVVPVFKDINPRFSETILENIGRLQEVELIFRQNIEEKMLQVVEKKGNNYFFSIPKLRRLFPLHTYLYEFLKPFGFNATVVSDIIASITGAHPGKQFFSFTHRMVRDRENFILHPLSASFPKKIILQENEEKKLLPRHFQPHLQATVHTQKMDKNLNIIKNNAMAFLDRDLLDFPLHFRKWRDSDYFYPFGMNGKKKLSDYFIDKKMSIPEKEDCWILVSGEKIIWIVNYRIDDRFKITDKTKNVLIIKTSNYTDDEQ